MKQIRPLVPKGAIYADDYNALAQELMRQANMSIEGLPDSQIDDTTAGRGITLPRPFFGIWARISNPDNAAAPWAWRQVRPIENGQFADMIDSEGPREGFVTRDPLYPSDGEIVPDGAVRFIVKGCVHTDGAGVQTDWLTLSGGAGGGGGNCTFTAVTSVCLRDGHLHVQKTTFRSRDCAIVGRTCVVDPDDCCTPDNCGLCYCQIGNTYSGQVIYDDGATYEFPMGCSPPSMFGSHPYGQVGLSLSCQNGVLQALVIFQTGAFCILGPPGVYNCTANSLFIQWNVANLGACAGSFINCIRVSGPI